MPGPGCQCFFQRPGLQGSRVQLSQPPCISYYLCQCCPPPPVQSPDRCPGLRTPLGAWSWGAGPQCTTTPAPQAGARLPVTTPLLRVDGQAGRATFSRADLTQFQVTVHPPGSRMMSPRRTMVFSRSSGGGVVGKGWAQSRCLWARPGEQGRTKAWPLPQGSACVKLR